MVVKVRPGRSRCEAYILAVFAILYQCARLRGERAIGEDDYRGVTSISEREKYERYQYTNRLLDSRSEQGF